MRQLKKFEEFLSLGLIKKQSKDRERAEDLKLEAEEKYSFF